MSSPALHNQMWHHHQNINRTSEAWCRWVKIVFLRAHHVVYESGCGTNIYWSSMMPYCDIRLWVFLHNRLWISPWIKSISNELDITPHLHTQHNCQVNCDVITSVAQSNVTSSSGHKQNKWGMMSMSENRYFTGSSRCVRKWMMYVPL